MNQEAEDRVFDNLNYQPRFIECEGCGKVISSKEMYCKGCKKPLSAAASLSSSVESK